jgi:hypothetical protein
MPHAAHGAARLHLGEKRAGGCGALEFRHKITAAISTGIVVSDTSASVQRCAVKTRWLLSPPQDGKSGFMILISPSSSFAVHRSTLARQDI